MELIRRRPVRSQDELASALRHSGVEATQSTVSRDIREMGLVKVRGSYQAPGDFHSTPSDDALRRAFGQYILRTGVSGNIVMIRTSPGNAHSVGAVLDAAEWPEVLGTVAGDDTLFVLLRHARFGRKVLERIREFSI